MDENEILYHYTTIYALNEIIRTRKVWASDCRYLNDRYELSRAIDIFLNLHDGKAHEILKEAFYWHNFSRAHCVFSLSKSPEVLSQWRAYAADGCGGAIGIYRKHLLNPLDAGTKFIVDCIYDEHEEFIEKIAHNFKDEISQLIAMYEREPAVNSFWSNIDKNPKPLEAIYSQLIRVKNTAFVEEREVRLVVNVPASAINTRVSNGVIIPYIEHQLANNHEKHFWCVAPEIWFGPKSDERNIHALSVFQQFGWMPGRSIRRFDCGYK